MERRNQILTGRSDLGEKPLQLMAGPLTLWFEPETAFLRYIRLGKKELIRAIYVAVRDEYWRTAPPRVTALRYVSTPGAFTLHFDVECRLDKIDYLWTGEITGKEDGAISFRMHGKSRSSFLHNRIGFCVLHPAECAGRPCLVEKVDGTRVETAFPLHIAPHQPFKDVRAITHEGPPGVRVKTRMEGDVFETEDQRNWTDASFKTYCTPLDRERPVEVHPGDEVRQSVTISLSGHAPVARDRKGEEPEVVLHRPNLLQVPLSGLGLATTREAIAADSALHPRLRALNLDHLRAEVDFRNGWPEALEHAGQLAADLNVPIILDVVLSNDPAEQVSRLAEQLHDFRANISSCLVFHGDEPGYAGQWVRAAREQLGAVLGSARFGGGSRTYFTELNRDRPQPGDADLVTYPVNPQVHAFDDRSLFETLPMLAETVATARDFLGNVTLCVGPVTLRPRFNPHTGVPDPGSESRLPSNVDSRQMSLLAAPWTLGALKHLLESRIDNLTLFATVGSTGVAEHEAGSRNPALFPSIPGAVYPLYHVLRWVSDFRGGQVLPCRSGSPDVEGLLLESNGRRRLLVGNMTASVQAVRVDGFGVGRYVRIKELNENNATSAGTDPEAFHKSPGLLREVAGDQLSLALLPYQVSVVDTDGDTECG